MLLKVINGCRMTFDRHKARLWEFKIVKSRALIRERVIQDFTITPKFVRNRIKISWWHHNSHLCKYMNDFGEGVVHFPSIPRTLSTYNRSSCNNQDQGSHPCQCRSTDSPDWSHGPSSGKVFTPQGKGQVNDPPARPDDHWAAWYTWPLTWPFN